MEATVHKMSIASVPASFSPEEIKEIRLNAKMAQRICALANGAALEGKHTAYFLWGIDDSTHEIIGT